MKDIESLISPLIQAQFPDFYKAEGPRFIDFVKQYYVWMEQQNQAVGSSRSLFDIRDIDRTSSDFIVYFKNKYLNKVPLTSQANTQLLTKHALDLYNVKGTKRGVEFVIRGFFNEESVVRYPGEDVFRASNGTWVKPVYLELSVTERTRTFVGRQIIGNQSGATAFIESLVKRRVGTKYIDIVYLSSVIGNFETNELVTPVDDLDLEGAPKIVGSLTNLTIIAGGAELSVGDLFNITSTSGKQGVARVASVSNETGKVTFLFVDALTSGGWGYSTNADVRVSQKVLVLNDQFNSNTQLTTFTQFEQVQQTLKTITFDTATPNTQGFTVGSVIENYDGAGVVVANAVIVNVSTTNTTAGTMLIAPGTANAINSFDATIALKGNTHTATILTFNDRTATGNVIGSNTTAIRLVFNGQTDVSNTDDTIHSLSFPFVNNQVVRYVTPVGNTSIGGLSNNFLYYVANTTETSFQLASTYNGTPINITAKGSSEANHSFLTYTGYVGVINVSSNGFVITPYANVVGLTSNTSARVSNVSTGTSADFDVGTITDTETVLATPDFLRNKNTGNVVFYTIDLLGINANTDYTGAYADTFNPFNIDNANDAIAFSNANHYSSNDAILYIANTGNTVPTNLTNNTIYFIDVANTTHVSLKATKSGTRISLVPGVNETGHNLIGPMVQLSSGDVAVRGFGFPKYPGAHLDSTILDCLRFDAINVGSIASITSINPGNDYNVDPFVVVVEPYIAGYDRHDYIMTVENSTGTFLKGETVQQSLSSVATVLTVTGFSGTAANGSSTTNVEPAEEVYQEYPNTAVRARGFVSEGAIDSGSGSIKLINVTGTFVNTSNSSTFVYSRTTGGTANVANVDITTTTTLARAIVKEGSNSTNLFLKRINLENTFIEGSANPLIGRSSGVTANVVNVDEDRSTIAIGLNANIIANVQTANGVATSLQVVDSGFGYINQETVTLTSANSVFEITAIAEVRQQGEGSGFFSSTRGFLDSDKKLHDNDFYQDFSYEVTTKISFNEYFDILKQLTHVAGTRAFGKVDSLSIVNTPLSVTSDIVLQQGENQYVESYTKTFSSLSYTSEYTAAYSSVYTSSFTGVYSTVYTPISYTGLYTQPYTGAYQQGFTGGFAYFFVQTYEGSYLNSFSRAFTVTGSNSFVSYVGTYGGTYLGVYTSVYGSGSFTSDTLQSYLQNYAGSFTSSYSRVFTQGIFTEGTPSLFTGSYNPSFIAILFGGIGIYTSSTISYTGVYTTPAYSSTYTLISNVFKGEYVTYTATYTKTWIGNYTNTFGLPYTRNFTASYTSPIVYTTAFTGVFTQPYAGNYSRVFSGPISYTGAFQQLFTRGFTNQFSRVFSSQFTNQFSGAYTEGYRGSYAQNSFTANYSAVYGVSFSSQYTAAYVNTYTGTTWTRVFTGVYADTIYSGAFSKFFSGTFTETYTKAYTVSFTGVYGRLFTQAYITSYSPAYSASFSATFTQPYTRTYSQLSFYTPAYTGIYTTNTFSKSYGAYTSTYTGSNVSFSSSYQQQYTGAFTSTYGLFNASNYSRIFTGTFTGVFAGLYSVTFSRPYTGSFTSTFGTAFSGNTFSRIFTLSYTSEVFTKAYTSNYGTPYTRSFTGSFIGNSYVTYYSKTFTGASASFISSYSSLSYTSNFTGAYTGVYGTFTSSFTGAWTESYTTSYTQAYTKTFTTAYTGGFVGSYSGLFTITFSGTTFSGVYSKSYTGNFASYTGVYSESFTGAFTGSYISTYSSLFSGVYGAFAKAYTSSFTGQFTGAYNLSFTNVYTKNVYTGEYNVGFNVAYTGSYSRAFTVAYGSYATSFTGAFSGVYVGG